MRRSRGRGRRTRALPVMTWRGGWSHRRPRCASAKDGASIPCVLEPAEGIRGCAESREEDGEEKEGCGSFDGAGIGGRCWQTRGAPTRNLDAQRQAEGGKGGRKRRGSVGTPIYHSGIPVMHTTHDPMISMS
jgi:hypothetical protein